MSLWTKTSLPECQSPEEIVALVRAYGAYPVRGKISARLDQCIREAIDSGALVALTREPGTDRYRTMPRFAQGRWLVLNAPLTVAP